MKKKCISMLLAAAVVAGTLAGCGNSANPSGTDSQKQTVGTENAGGTDSQKQTVGTENAGGTDSQK